MALSMRFMPSCLFVSITFGISKVRAPGWRPDGGVHRRISMAGTIPGRSVRLKSVWLITAAGVR